MRVRVKICGITSLRDAEVAAEAGADAVGFVFWNGSPRRVSVADVTRITPALPPYVTRVGVFVNELRPVLLSAMRNGGLSVAQLHGEEEPQDCARLGVDWYKVFKAGAGDLESLLSEISRFEARSFMLDNASSSRPGGTGRSFDWSMAERLASRLMEKGPVRLILAGGLSPENVGEAVKRLGQNGLWGVDVSSGVEVSPGRKDAQRVKAFIEAVRSAG